MDAQTVNPFKNGNTQAFWSGVPPNYIGTDGYTITDTTTGNVYQKAAGYWVLQFTGSTGGGTQADWNAATGSAAILNKPTLATVAATGNYSDLAGKPTIPTPSGQTIANSTAATANNTGTGTLLDAPMFSASVPASSIIPQSGILKLEANIKYTSSASAKAVQCYYGGVLVVAALALPASTANALVEVFVTNTGTATAQTCFARVTTSAGMSISPTTTVSVNTAAVQNFGLYSELTTSGDTMQTLTWKVTASN